MNVEEDLACSNCEFSAEIVDGVPLLVRDRQAIEREIAAAKSAGRSDWYEGSHDREITGPYRHHVAKRRRYLEDLLSRRWTRGPAGTMALDLGCGDGVHLPWLRRHAETVVGSDYNLTRLLRVSGSDGALVFLADATDYPALDDAFDLVFMNHVLEHIPDDRRALAEVARILKPGGLAIIGVPNEGASWWQLAYRLQPAQLAASDHVHFYTASSLATRCREAGLEPIEVEHIGWGIPHWSLDARVRGRKWVDDLFERLGRRFFPRQATSLYLTLSK